MGKSGSDKINPARRRRRVAFCKSSPRNQLQAHGLLVSSTQRFGSPEAYTPRPLAEKILTSKSALEGERKQVTVLLAGRAGVTRRRGVEQERWFAFPRFSAWPVISTGR
jgi:hypothetical protein